MRLSRQFLGAPSAGYTLSSVTLGDTNAVDLVGGATTVDLELDDMSLLLLEREKFHLGVGNKSNNLAVLLDLAPVLVESSAGSIGDVLGPDGLKSPQASWRLNVAHYADSDHGRRLDDGDWLDDFLFVELRSLSGDH